MSTSENSSIGARHEDESMDQIMADIEDFFQDDSDQSAYVASLDLDTRAMTSGDTASILEQNACTIGKILEECESLTASTSNSEQTGIEESGSVNEATSSSEVPGTSGVQTADRFIETQRKHPVVLLTRLSAEIISASQKVSSKGKGKAGVATKAKGTPTKAQETKKGKVYGEDDALSDLSVSDASLTDFAEFANSDEHDKQKKSSDFDGSSDILYVLGSACSQEGEASSSSGKNQGQNSSVKTKAQGKTSARPEKHKRQTEGKVEPANRKRKLEPSNSKQKDQISSKSAKQTKHVPESGQTQKDSQTTGDSTPLASPKGVSEEKCKQSEVPVKLADAMKQESKNHEPALKYKLQLSPIFIEDLANESFRKFINLALDCAVDFSKEMSGQIGTVSLYFGDDQGIAGAIQRLCQLPVLEGRERMCGLITYHALQYSKWRREDKRWKPHFWGRLAFDFHPSEAEKLQQLVQQKERKSENSKQKIAIIHRIPCSMGRKMLSPLFPYSVGIKIPEQKALYNGPVEVVFESEAWMNAVLSCFRNLCFHAKKDMQHKFFLLIKNFEVPKESLSDKSEHDRRPEVRGRGFSPGSSSRPGFVGGRSASGDRSKDRRDGTGQRDRSGQRKQGQSVFRQGGLQRERSMERKGRFDRPHQTSFRTPEKMSETASIMASNLEGVRNIAAARELDVNNPDVLRILEMQLQLETLHNITRRQAMEANSLGISVPHVIAGRGLGQGAELDVARENALRQGDSMRFLRDQRGHQEEVRDREALRLREARQREESLAQGSVQRLEEARRWNEARNVEEAKRRDEMLRREEAERQRVLLQEDALRREREKRQQDLLMASARKDFRQDHHTPRQRFQGSDYRNQVEGSSRQDSSLRGNGLLPTPPASGVVPAGAGAASSTTKTSSPFLSSKAKHDYGSRQRSTPSSRWTPQRTEDSGRRSQSSDKKSGVSPGPRQGQKDRSSQSKDAGQNQDKPSPFKRRSRWEDVAEPGQRAGDPAQKRRKQSRWETQEDGRKSAETAGNPVPGGVDPTRNDQPLTFGRPPPAKSVEDAVRDDMERSLKASSASKGASLAVLNQTHRGHRASAAAEEVLLPVQFGKNAEKKTPFVLASEKNKNEKLMGNRRDSKGWNPNAVDLGEASRPKFHNVADGQQRDFHQAGMSRGRGGVLNRGGQGGSPLSRGAFSTGAQRGRGVGRGERKDSWSEQGSERSWQRDEFARKGGFGPQKEQQQRPDKGRGGRFSGRGGFGAESAFRPQQEEEIPERSQFGGGYEHEQDGRGREGRSFFGESGGVHSRHAPDESKNWERDRKAEHFDPHSFAVPESRHSARDGQVLGGRKVANLPGQLGSRGGGGQRGRGVGRIESQREFFPKEHTGYGQEEHWDYDSGVHPEHGADAYLDRGRDGGREGEVGWDEEKEVRGGFPHPRPAQGGVDYGKPFGGGDGSLRGRGGGRGVPEPGREGSGLRGRGGRGGFMGRGGQAQQDSGRFHEGRGGRLDRGRAGLSNVSRGGHFEQGGRESFSEGSGGGLSNRGRGGYSDRGRGGVSERGKGGLPERGRGGLSERGRGGVSERGRGVFSNRGRGAAPPHGQNVVEREWGRNVQSSDHRFQAPAGSHSEDYGYGGEDQPQYEEVEGEYGYREKRGPPHEQRGSFGHQGQNFGSGGSGAHHGQDYGYDETSSSDLHFHGQDEHRGAAAWHETPDRGRGRGSQPPGRGRGVAASRPPQAGAARGRGRGRPSLLQTPPAASSQEYGEKGYGGEGDFAQYGGYEGGSYGEPSQYEHSYEGEGQKVGEYGKPFVADPPAVHHLRGRGVRGRTRPARGRGGSFQAPYPQSQSQQHLPMDSDIFF
ncbi:hornerin [Aplysia californica]|uniref:Hornerin n=1 Tax=Aplysia californica TaxID=6500 RepID=A0ABM0JEL6_APLCA|nr:hornerin [Aplysia californica]